MKGRKGDVWSSLSADLQSQWTKRLHLQRLLRSTQLPPQIATFCNDPPTPFLLSSTTTTTTAAAASGSTSSSSTSNDNSTTAVSESSTSPLSCAADKPVSNSFQTLYNEYTALDTYLEQLDEALHNQLELLRLPLALHMLDDSATESRTGGVSATTSSSSSSTHDSGERAGVSGETVSTTGSHGAGVGGSSSLSYRTADVPNVYVERRGTPVEAICGEDWQEGVAGVCFGGYGDSGNSIVQQSSPQNLRSSLCYRINVYNLYKHQLTGHYEVDSFNPNPLPPSISPSTLYELPPSWTLKILGTLISPTPPIPSPSTGTAGEGGPAVVVGGCGDGGGGATEGEKLRGSSGGTGSALGDVVGGSGGTMQQVGLSTMFSKIVVISKDETIIWDSSRDMSNGLSSEPEEDGDRPVIRGSAGHLECDGLEVKRLGEEEQTLTILFYLKFDTPFYQLSPQLSTIVGLSHSTLPSLVCVLWKYILKNGLQSRDDPMSLQCDAALKQLFNGDLKGEDSFSLGDLRRLLKPHLLPPRPVTIKHKLRLSGDWIENEQVYDFYVERPAIVSSNLLYNSHNSLSRVSASSSGPLLADSVHLLCGSVHSMNYVDRWLPLPSLQLITAKHHVLLDEIDKQLAQCITKIMQRVSNRNFYLGFAENPSQFIHSLTASKQPDVPSASFLDPNFVEDYTIPDKRSDYYRQPWVNHAVSNYLRTHNKPFVDEIGRVLASMNLPDPRKRPRGMTAEDGHRESRSGTRGRRATGGAVGRPRKRPLVQP